MLKPGAGAAVPTSPPQAAALTGVVTVVMTLIGWSSVPLFISHFARSIDVWTSNGWRYGFSALLWAPVLAWGAARAGRGPDGDGAGLPAGLWRAALVPAALNALGQVAFAWSFYKIDPATATFGLRMQIVFVAIGAYWLFPSERAVLRRPAAWAGIALVLAGIGGTILLAPADAGVPGLGADPSGDAGTGRAFGVALAIGAGLLFACYGLSVRRFMHRFHPVTAFAAISQYTALVMVALMLALAHRVVPATGGGAAGGVSGAWDGGWSAAELPRGQFALLLLSAVIGIALGHVFYYISIARLGVAVSSGVIQLQPFCVALGSYFLFDKVLGFGQIVSGSVAVLGAVMLLGVQWRVSRAARSAGAAAAAGGQSAEFVAAGAVVPRDAGVVVDAAAGAAGNRV